MKALTNEEQELLLLRYVNEISFSDLSKLHGKSRFALYRELSKITKKLGGQGLYMICMFITFFIAVTMVNVFFDEHS